jgi:SAM-dependent methyltransferase
MQSKPPGWSVVYGAVFGEPDVVRAYHLRPPYPADTIAELLRLASGGAVIDAGCGTGELARRLAPHVTRVDAVDVSAAMLAAARSLPGSDTANLHWVSGAIEDVPLVPPYALAVAGDSVHWFDWTRAFARFAALLAADGVLAIVHREWLRDERTREKLTPIYARHSWNSDFADLDLIEELERRGLFIRFGEHVSAPSPWEPTLDEIVDCHFSMSGFARSRLKDPNSFAHEVREAVASSLPRSGGRYELDVVGTVVWGRPGTGSEPLRG